MSQKTIILVPYPTHSHVSPMLKLALAFLNLGFSPVIVTPEFIHRKLNSCTTGGLHAGGVTFLSVPDSSGRDQVPGDFFGIEEVVENSLPFHLERVVHDLDEDGGVACVVVDLLVSSAVEVAHRCGVPVAGFWPAMLATFKLIAAIPNMVAAGLISDTGSPLHHDPSLILPNQPALSTEDLPWLIGTPTAREGRFRFWKRVISRSKSLCWLIVNSFPEEEADTRKPADNALLDDPLGQPSVFQVGGLTMNAPPRNEINPSFSPKGSCPEGANRKDELTEVQCSIPNKCNIDRNFTSRKTKINPSFLEEDTSCLQWLDTQKSSSVVYISFGSWVSPLGDGKVRNLALALEATGQPFLWALGHSWRKELPSGFQCRSLGQGKVVSWVPQLEVLKHKAVGCYLTHCGWNSIMEAIKCQKPLLCCPLAGDQFVNCAYVVDKWRVGVRISGGFGREEFDECLRSVMEDEGIGHRLRKLHGKNVGDDAHSEAMARLEAFVHDIL